MDSIIEEKEEDIDFIKIYLQIHYPKIEDKPYYKIDFDKNILVLFDPVNRTHSEKDGIFEMDKIFTNENDNSYIYEEICSNTIKESLKGESYVFISYGNTISDKLKILIGDVNDSYIKVEHRGLFPKVLERLISTINNNKSYSENLSINLSYFLLLNDKLIDLSNYIGKKFDDYNEHYFIKNSIELEKKGETIKNIKKVPTENINDVLFFINKFFLLLINLEEESEYHLYSRAHFSSIIYIINNNGEIISTLTFILLNGNEIMNRRNNSPQSVNKNISKEHLYKNNVEASLIAVESQHTYDSIIYSLKNNISINQITDNEDKNSEKNKISKLTRLLYDICFNPKKEHIKFRIIGSILPNTGYYDTCKDTLMFLFNCRKAISNTSKIKEKKNLIEKLMNNNSFRSNMIRKDTIFDLENKLKIQTNTIAELNINIEKKQNKLIELEKYYKKQVDFLKNYFGFTGNVEILLSGDQNTNDYKEAQEIREAKDNINYYKKNINDLENKLKNKENEIKKLKIEDTIKINDNTMIKYYLGVNESKKKKEKANKNRNDIFNQIKTYEKELKNKDKIINILKKDLEKKSSIIESIPKTIKNHIDKKDNESSIDSNEIIIIKDKKLKVNKNDLIQLAKDNNEEIKSLELKYDNLIKQKDKEIFENNYQINKIIKDNKTKLNLYDDELLKLYELFMTLINYFKNNFVVFFNEKSSLVSLLRKKEELELFIENIQKEINAYNFPFIFKALNSKNIFSLNNNNLKEKLLNNTKKKLIINNRINNPIEDKKDISLNFEDITKYTTLQQINNFINTKKINNNLYDQTQLEQMSKDELIQIYNNINKYINDLEKLIKNYNKEKDQYNLKNKKEENSKKMQMYEEKIKKLNILLDNEVQKNVQNMVIISSHKKMIEKLQRESITKNILKYKNDYSSQKISLTKSKDKYPILVHEKNNTINENNFINYKKSSFQVKWRNKTENNYQTNYQPTNGTSGYSSLSKTYAITIDNSTNNKSKNKVKKRAFSSKGNKIKNDI